jgi:hypothetical protein
MMDAQEFKPGDLFFLTNAYQDYVFQRTGRLKVSMVNRIAKLEQIIDWGSETGKKIKDARLKTGKWKDLPLEDNKYIFSVYYHDLKGRNNQTGVVERGVPLFSKDPKTGSPFFVKIPDWIFKEIQKKCVTFEVQDK